MYLHLFPEERPDRSKVYAANDSIELACAWAPWMPFACEALHTLPHGSPLWPFDYAMYSMEFSRVVRRLGLDMVPYQARHSGPSIDAARGSRTRAERKDRGRWASDTSVIRYERTARLMESFNQLPARLQSHGLECERRLAALFYGQVAPAELLLSR